MKSGSWLISFADLLTLLLASVLMGWCLRGELPDLRQVSDIALKKQVGGVGIQVAAPFVSTREKVAFLFERDFQNGGESLRKFLEGLWSESDNCLGSCDFQVEIATCGSDVGGSMAAMRHASLRRLLMIHRHLFDGKSVRSQMVTLSLMGSRCEDLGFRGVESEQEYPVAAIRFKDTGSNEKRG